MTLEGWLAGAEPAEVTWTPAGITVVAATDRQWATERRDALQAALAKEARP